jgi:hypothetical protein
LLKNDGINHVFLCGLDFNSKSAICAPAKSFFAGRAHACRQVDFRPVDRVLAADNVSSLCRTLGEHKIKRFTCLEQFLCLAFAQLTCRESLRDIEACPRAHREKLYHMGIRSRVSRSTLADANELRDWRIYADFAQRLIARRLNSSTSWSPVHARARAAMTDP